MSQYSKQRIMNFNIFSSKYNSDVIIGQKAIPYVLHEHITLNQNVQNIFRDSYVAKHSLPIIQKQMFILIL
jgi:hypothetical protein